jgi:hypothetical protein
MNPGVYVLEGGAMNFSSNVVVKGSGVMIYFTCSGYSTSNTAPCSLGAEATTCGAQTLGLSLSSNSVMQITPPSGGVYKGMGIFYDRNLNTSAICLASNTSTNTLGTIYARSADLIISSNAGTQSGAVVNAVQVASNSAIAIDGSVNGGIAPRNDGSVAGPSFAQIAA